MQSPKTIRHLTATPTSVPRKNSPCTNTAHLTNTNQEREQSSASSTLGSPLAKKLAPLSELRRVLDFWFHKLPWSRSHRGLSRLSRVERSGPPTCVVEDRSHVFLFQPPGFFYIVGDGKNSLNGSRSGAPYIQREGLPKSAENSIDRQHAVPDTAGIQILSSLKLPSSDCPIFCFLPKEPGRQRWLAATPDCRACGFFHGTRPGAVTGRGTASPSTPQLDPTEARAADASRACSIR